MEKFQGDKYNFSFIQPLMLVNNDIIEQRCEQISKLHAELIEYKILIRDLIGDKINNKERTKLLNVAMYIIENMELYEEFSSSKNLPIDKFYIKVGLQKKYIEKYKEYIITYIIIFGNPYYKCIQDYIKIVEKKDCDKEINEDDKSYEEKESYGENESDDSLIANKSQRGIVLKISKRNAIIITSMGEFKKVSKRNYCGLGEEISSKERKSLSDYKLQLSIISVLLLSIALFFVYKYNKVIRIVVVKTTSPIRLEVNDFNRILRVSSPTEKGNILIDNTNIIDRDMDMALHNVIKYANENEMIETSGIIITVSGIAVGHGEIENVEKYVGENFIRVRFNNSGNEHKIN